MPKIGLALGAGSTKGYAHLGVLEVLQENHIQIDMIAGSSIGAIVAAIYACGTNIPLLEKFALQLNLREYMDIGKPSGGGLLKGDRLEALIRILTHNKSFEQTNIPLYCTAVNAGSGELEILQSGNVARAVRASMSIPGIFRPVEIDGGFYIDGGVLERIPCRVLRDNGADIVIGVDVGYTGGDFDVSGMNAYGYINRAIDIMQWKITKGQDNVADIMMMPQVLFVEGHFDTKNAAFVIDEGRRVAEEALPQIKRMIENMTMK